MLLNDSAVQRFIASKADAEFLSAQNFVLEDLNPDPDIVNGVPTAAGRIHFYQGSIRDGGASTCVWQGRTNW